MPKTTRVHVFDHLRRTLSLAVIGGVSLATPVAHAAGPTGAISTIADGPGPQDRPRLAVDGQNGLYVAYRDAASGIDELRLRRLSALNAGWSAPVVVAAPADGYFHSFWIAPTSSGVFVAWHGSAGTYVQRYDGKGAAKFASPIKVRFDVASFPSSLWGIAAAHADSVWVLSEAGGRCGVTHIDATGTSQKTMPLKKAQCVASGDGTGGVVVASTVSLTPTNDVVVVHRFDANGAPVWGANGIALTDADAYGIKSSPVMVTGAAGVLVTWADRRGASPRRFGQLIDETGTPRWSRNGIDMAPASIYDDPAVDSQGVLVAYGISLKGTFLRRIGLDGSIVFDKKVDALDTASGGVDVVATQDAVWLAWTPVAQACVRIARISPSSGDPLDSPVSVGTCGTYVYPTAVGARLVPTSALAKPRTALLWAEGPTASAVDLKMWLETPPGLTTVSAPTVTKTISY